MAKRPSIGDYLETIKESAPRMLSDIGELAKAEIKPAAKHGGIGAGAFGVAAVFGTALLWILLLVTGFAFAIIFNQAVGMSAVTSLCLGFLCVAGLALVLSAVFGVLGYLQIKKVKAPEMTIAETKASVKAISEAVSNGVRDAQDGNPGAVTLKSGQFPAESGAVVAPRPTDITATDDWADALKPPVTAGGGASRVEWK